MEELELVLKVFKCGPDSIETLSLMNSGFILINRKLLNENVTMLYLISIVIISLVRTVTVKVIGLRARLDGIEELSSRNRVNSIAKFIM